MTESRSLILPFESLPAIVPKPPDLIAAAGTSARFAWDEFFAAQIRNSHTRLYDRRQKRVTRNIVERISV